MGVNLHKPERYDWESQSAYRIRQKESTEYVKRNTSGRGEQLTPFKPPTNNPLAKPSRDYWFTGQHTNKANNEFRKLKRRFGARQVRRMFYKKRNPI